jgi:hypothetical protein
MQNMELKRGSFYGVGNVELAVDDSDQSALHLFFQSWLSQYGRAQQHAYLIRISHPARDLRAAGVAADAPENQVGKDL